MFFHQCRLILSHALPMLIAQLASTGMIVIDTVLLGHYNTEDLAAAAVGSGIYVAVLFALTGVLQAVSPTVSHLKGAGKNGEIAGALQQCFWLAVILAVPGVLFLHHPGALLQLSEIEPGVETREGVSRHAGLGNACRVVLPDVLCVLQCPGATQTLDADFAGRDVAAWFSAWQLVSGTAGLPALGVIGCSVSNVLVGWFSLACGLLYVVRGRARTVSVAAALADAAFCGDV